MSFRMHAMEMYAPYGDVKTGILQLQTMLKKREEQVEVIRKIHSVLLGLWTIKWGKKRDGQITIVDPTEHCLALLMLKDSGSFKEPNELTGLISKFEYCMCLTFLYELHLRVNREKTICFLGYYDYLIVKNVQIVYQLHLLILYHLFFKVI